MRTKTLLLTAALVAAGVASSMAQSNVYSLNVVGYVNLQLTNGFNLVSNPLDADGTGTNNTVQGVFGNNLPVNSSVYKFSGGGFNTFYLYGSRGWSGNGSMNPGEAVFVSVPTATNITIVGQVLQGTLTNANVNPAGGFSFLSSVIPVTATIDSTGNGGLGYVPAANDSVYVWDNSLTPPAYDVYLFARGSWAPHSPVINVGTGFFLNTTQTSWVQSFTVQ